MATTPHSSLNLSNIRCQGPLVSRSQGGDFPRAKRHVPLTDLDPLLNCSSDHWRFDLKFSGNRRDALGFASGDQNARRTFVKDEHLGPQIALQIHLRPDFRRTEGAFGEGYPQTAVAQVVGGLRKSLLYDAADGV